MPAKGAGSAVAMSPGSLVEHSILIGAGSGMYFFKGGGESTGGLRDRLVLAENGIAISIVAQAIVNLDGVTAIARGTESGRGIALLSTSSAGAPGTINATDTIARGATRDVTAEASAGEPAVVNLHYSDARTASELAQGAGAKVNDSDHPTHGEPLFVSATDFHEALGSPTIGAGTADAASGLFDLDGLARAFGAAQDIGAYEFHGALPAVVTGPASGVGQAGATLGGTVDAEEVPTGWYFNYGPTGAYGSKTPMQSLPASFAVQPVAAAIGGLAPGTTYHYQLVAANAVGVSAGADATFVTAPGPAAAPADSALRLSRARFRAAVRGATISAASAIGTTISYSDTQAATTTFTVRVTAAGVRSGHACVAPPRHPRHGHRYTACTRYASLGSFAHSDVVGVNRLRFSGRLHGRRLAPHAYRLTAKPQNRAGQAGSTLSTSFTITR